MKRLVLALAILLTPTMALANYTCAGTVDRLVIAPSGTVTVSVGSLQWVYICRIGETYNGISSDVCKAIYAHLLAAKAQAKQEKFYFEDSLTCATHPAWANLTGWYFGPDFQ